MTKTRKAAGFTLVELLIVVSIMAILTAVAYPSYMEHIRDSRRAEGRGLLLDTAQALERCKTLYGYYISEDEEDAECQIVTDITDGKLESTEGFYFVDAVADPTAATFQLQAIPVNADLDCGTLLLDQNGGRCIDSEKYGVGCVADGFQPAMDCW